MDIPIASTSSRMNAVDSIPTATRWQAFTRNFRSKMLAVLMINLTYGAILWPMSMDSGPFGQYFFPALKVEWGISFCSTILVWSKCNSEAIIPLTMGGITTLVTYAILSACTSAAQGTLSTFLPAIIVLSMWCNQKQMRFYEQTATRFEGYPDIAAMHLQQWLVARTEGWRRARRQLQDADVEREL